MSGVVYRMVITMAEPYNMKRRWIQSHLNADEWGTEPGEQERTLIERMKTPHPAEKVSSEASSKL